MNSTQAISKLRKLLGPKAALQDGKRDSSLEQREHDRAAHQSTLARKRACEDAMTARRQAVLNADDEYQRLKREYEQAKQEHEKQPYGLYHRYSAGRISGVGGMSFFHTEAEADTLAELVEKVEAKRQ